MYMDVSSPFGKSVAVVQKLRNFDTCSEVSFSNPSVIMRFYEFVPVSFATIEAKPSWRDSVPFISCL